MVSAKASRRVIALTAVCGLAWFAIERSEGRSGGYYSSDAENARLDAEIQQALKTTGTYTPPNARMAAPKPDVEHLEIEDFNWRKDGFGTVMVASFVVNNQLPTAVKDIGVRCSLFSESGTKLASVGETVYKRFTPGKTKVNDLNLGFIHTQARSAKCAVVKLVK